MNWQEAAALHPEDSWGQEFGSSSCKRFSCIQTAVLGQKMTQQVKKKHFNAQNPHAGGKEPTQTCCPLTATHHTLTHITYISHTHTHITYISHTNTYHTLKHITHVSHTHMYHTHITHTKLAKCKRKCHNNVTYF